MARLPIPHRRKSRAQAALEVAKSVGKAWAALNLASAGARAAKKGAKAYGAVKTAKVAGRPVIKLVAVPVGIAAGALAVRKVVSSSSEPEYGGAAAPGGAPQAPGTPAPGTPPGAPDVSPAGAAAQTAPHAAEAGADGSGAAGPESVLESPPPPGETAFEEVGSQSPAVSADPGTADVPVIPDEAGVVPPEEVHDDPSTPSALERENEDEKI